MALLLRVMLAKGERGARGVEGDFRARTGVLKLRGVMGGVGGRRAGWEKLLLRTIDMICICFRSLLGGSSGVSVLVLVGEVCLIGASNGK